MAAFHSRSRRTDGTATGTKVLTDFPDGNSVVPGVLTAFGRALLFTQPGTQLWTYLPASASVSEGSDSGE